MTQTIWKFPLGKFMLNSDVFDVPMPKGATLLSVAEQYGDVVLYALVNPSNEMEPRGILVLGTGHLAPDDIDQHLFLGTVKLANGSLMFHVFEEGLA